MTIVAVIKSISTWSIFNWVFWSVQQKSPFVTIARERQMRRLKTNFILFVSSLKEKVSNRDFLMQSAFPQGYWWAASQVIFAMSEGSSFVFAWLKSISSQKGYDSWVVSQWGNIYVNPVWHFDPPAIKAIEIESKSGNKDLLIWIGWASRLKRPVWSGEFYRQLIPPSSA